MGNIGPIDSVVRWRNGQLIEVRFDAGIHASVLDYMVTTMSHRSLLETPRATAVDTLNVNSDPEPKSISIRIRQPSKMDYRMAITDLGLTLPLANEADLEAVFHHALSGIFVRPSHNLLTGFK